MSALNLRHFEKNLIVRPLRAADWEDVLALQRRCFPGMEPWTREHFDSQLRIFPEGQIGIEYQGRIVASSSSLLLDFELYREWHNYEEVSDHGYIRNHKADGKTLYGIEIMVDPDLQGFKLARRLYDARKKLARERNLMRIVVGGRLPGYAAHAATLTPRQYVDRVIARKLHDPVLTTQLANGFVVKRILRNYLTGDAASDGYAAFVEWTNVDYVPDPARRFVPVAPVRICAVQYQMRLLPDFAAFEQHCEYFVGVASEYKSDFIVFPELFTSQLLSTIRAPTPAAAVRKLAELTPRYLEFFTRMALKYNVNVVGGSQFTVEDDDDLYNIAYLFRRDGTLGKQYKLHITPTEQKWWGVKGGDRVEVFDTDRGRIAIQVCYDIEFPEVTRIAVEQGAQILFVPFCTDERYAYLRVRYCAQARCIENHVYAVIAGSVGNLPNVQTMGLHYAQSAILTPSDIPFKRDAIAAECTPNIETVVIEDLDLELLKRHRQSATVLNWNDRRRDLFEVRYLPERRERGESPTIPDAGDASARLPGS
jgi:predicted amidohydrolase/ribosomal protein S18 acetylase RimI-like enzyme